MGKTSNLYKRLIFFSRLVPLFGFGLVVAYEAVEHAFDIEHIFEYLQSRHGIFFLIGTGLFGFFMPLASWWLLRWIAHRVAERDQAEQELLQTYGQLQLSNRRLATLNEISRKLAEAADLDTLLEVAVRTPSQIIRVANCTIYLVDEITGNLVATSSYPPSEAGGLIGPSQPHLSSSAPPGPPHISFLLSYGERTIGALNLYLPPGQFPKEEEISLLQTMATGMAGAIESMRLRARHLLTIYEVDRTLRAESNLGRLLGEVLAKVMAVCRAHCGALLLHEEAGHQLRVHSTRRCGESQCAICAHMPAGYITQTTLTARPQLVVDVEREPVWEKEALPPGIRSLLSMPLITQGNPVGLIVLGHPQPGVFWESQLSLLSVVASQAALAVHNAQLYADAEQLAIAEERSRIAREIHDGVAQSLAFLRLKLDICRDFVDDRDRLLHELGACRDVLLEKIEELHRAIFALRPVELEKLGFVPALQNLTDGFQEAHSLSVELAVHGDTSLLSAKQELALFRVAQEFLNNAAKHAQARHLWVDLDLRSTQTACLDLHDDGQGFDPVAVQARSSPSSGTGLTHMQERIRGLGGAVTIDAAPGKGTHVVATLPLKQETYDGPL